MVRKPARLSRFPRHTDATMPSTSANALLHLAACAARAAVLAVFALYLQPDFMVTLANQVWACF
jgi:hypothetical protein